MLACKDVQQLILVCDVGGQKLNGDDDDDDSMKSIAEIQIFNC